MKSPLQYLTGIPTGPDVREVKGRHFSLHTMLYTVYITIYRGYIILTFDRILLQLD